MRASLSAASRRGYVPLLLGLALCLAKPSLLSAEESADVQKQSLAQLNEGGGVGGSGSTVLPDLFTGTLQYSYPIEVPAGRKGMAPKLALRYSSHGTNGWAGYGWNLDIPYIQRQGPRKGVPTYDDAQDRFLFVSGDATIELIPRPEWGAGYYGAKIEGGFAKFYNTNPSTTGWIVTDKSGMKQWFGTTAASRLDRASDLWWLDGDKKYRWYLNAVSDLNGNTMTFAYQKEAFYASTKGLVYNDGTFRRGMCNQIYVSRIDYPNSSVIFDWEGRADGHSTFFAGFCAWMDKRLKLIEVFGDTQRLRTYRLDYDDFSNAPNQSAYSRLKAITQYDRNATVSASGATWTVVGNSLRREGPIV
ncbi:MAG: SpvB/TcaC N-terminal domain-containing protein [Nitrospirota bacterium]